MVGGMKANQTGRTPVLLASLPGRTPPAINPAALRIRPSQAERTRRVAVEAAAHPTVRIGPSGRSVIGGDEDTTVGILSRINDPQTISDYLGGRRPTAEPSMHLTYVELLSRSGYGHGRLAAILHTQTLVTPTGEPPGHSVPSAQSKDLDALVAAPRPDPAAGIALAA